MSPMVNETGLGYEYDAGGDRARFWRRFPIESDGYRQQKELFVAGSPGSSPTEVFLICLITATSLIMHHVVSIYLSPKSSLLRFFLEFACVPAVILGSIFYPEYAFAIWLSQAALTGAILLLSKPSLFAANDGPEVLSSSRLRFLTWFRSAFMLCTCCCILAVDFPLFPRRLVKTESFGISVMDTGVGFVVLSSGIVSKQARAGPRAGLLKVLRSTLPMLVMGFARLASTRAVDYQMHLSEYGVHWNFFFTLAMVSLVSYLAGPLIDRYSAAIMAIIMAVLSQLLISTNIEFLLESDRGNLFSANREGIFSSLGYLSLYFFGVEIGQRVARAKSTESWWRLAVDLSTASAFCFTIVAILGPPNVSRRFANLPFVIWIVALNTAVLALELVYDLVSVRGRSHCMILNGVDRNQLAIFLISNLLTGAINLSMQTVYQGDFIALVCVASYLLIICVISAALDRHKVSLKFW